MLKQIGEVGLVYNSNINETLHIYDCRPWISAQGNKVAGRGFEKKKYYENASECKFCDIPNIFGVKSSFDSIVSMG